MIKKLAIAAVALLALGGTVSAFAWWDTLQETQNETLTIGEGTDLVLAVNAEAPVGKVLVPSGKAIGVNDVDSIVLTYDVSLSQATTNDLTLDVAVSNITLAGATTYAGLVNVVVSPLSQSINSTDVLVTVTVTITEPTTEAIYNAIRNGEIAFDLTFNAS